MINIKKSLPWLYNNRIFFLFLISDSNSIIEFRMFYEIGTEKIFFLGVIILNK